MARTQSWWDTWYMGLAHYAATASKDPSTTVGAVIVGENRRNLALGYNGFPPGIQDSEERLQDRKTKYDLTQHAERNALDNAQFSLEGSTLVVTAFPCLECAKSIIATGVKRVVCPPPPDPSAMRPWTQTCHTARLAMIEAGIVLRTVMDADVP